MAETSDSETDGKLFTCVICNKVFLEKYNLLRHLSTHEDRKTLKWNFCSNKFNRQDRTVEQIHSEETFACPHCPKIFLHQRSLKKHQSVHDDKDVEEVIDIVNDFACPDIHQRSYQSHQSESESVEKNGVHEDYEIKYEDIRFDCPMQIKHKSESLKRKEAPEDSNEVIDFPASSNMAESSDSETERNLYTCDICNKAFLEKYNLQSHLLMHVDPFLEHQQTYSEKKTFTCPHCPKKFSLQSSLYRHKSVHGERMPCEFCSKTFAQRRYWKRHMERHKDDKKVIEIVKGFRCPDCGLSYIHQRSLKKHQKRKHPPQIESESESLKREEDHGEDNMIDEDTHFSCPDCEKTYSHERSLKSHQKKRHPMQIKTESEYLKRKEVFEDDYEVIFEYTHFNCQDSETTNSLERSLKSRQERHHPMQIQHESESLKRIEAPEDENKVIDEDTHFSCPDCEKTYLHERSLKSHQKKRHPMQITNESEFLKREEAPEDDNKVTDEVVEIDEDMHFSCQDCEKTYSHERSLKSHRKRHHPMQIKHESESLKGKEAPESNNNVIDGDPDITEYP